MSIYLPEGTDRLERHSKLINALAGIPYLTPHDMIALMGGEPNFCTPDELAVAEWDLRTYGYKLRPIALWQCRPIFWRYVRDETWAEDIGVFNSRPPHQER